MACISGTMSATGKLNKQTDPVPLGYEEGGLG